MTMMMTVLSISITKSDCRRVIKPTRSYHDCAWNVCLVGVSGWGWKERREEKCGAKDEKERMDCGFF